MPRTLQQQVAELRELAVAEPASQGKIRAALGSPAGFLMAAAAGLVEDHRLEPLVPELSPAFERLCERLAAA